MRLLFWSKIRVAPSGDQGGQACNQSQASPNRHLRPVRTQQLVEKMRRFLTKRWCWTCRHALFLCTNGHDVHTKLRSSIVVSRALLRYGGGFGYAGASGKAAGAARRAPVAGGADCGVHPPEWRHVSCWQCRHHPTGRGWREPHHNRLCGGQPRGRAGRRIPATGTVRCGGCGEGDNAGRSTSGAQPASSVRGGCPE